MAFVADQFFSQTDATHPDEWVDFDQFLDLPSGYDDQSTATTVSPQDLSLPYENDGSFNSPSDFMQSSFDMINYDLPQEEFIGLDGGLVQDPAAPLFDDASFFGYNPYDSSIAFRHVVEVQAAADPRVASIKEKRREASIALHLQRLCDATALDLDMSSDSNTSFSSPSWSEYIRGSTSPHPSPENTSVSGAPPPGAGGMEMVLDLNMNAAANVPKKQKPRSQAQKENYIKARKYGACEKHKKQHKRCNCLEKAAARAAVSDVPSNAALQERPREQPMLQVPILPEARYSSPPGHDPTHSSPQALPTIKGTRKSAGLHGQDPSTGLPLALPIPQRIFRAKAQKLSSPGHDTVVLSGRKVTATSSVGPATVFSTENVANITRTGQPPGSFSSVASQKPASSSNLHGRVSIPSSIGAVSSGGTSISPTSSTNSPSPCTYCSPSLDVRQTRSTRTVDRSVVPGTVAGNLAMRHSTTATRSSGTHAPVPGHRSVPGALAKQLAVLSGMQLVPKDLLFSPSRRGSPILPGSELPNTGVWSPGLLVRSLAEHAGGLFSRIASAFAGIQQLSMSLASGAETMTYKCLSLFGRKLMSAKKGLHLAGLRIAYSL